MNMNFTADVSQRMIGGLNVCKLTTMTEGEVDSSPLFTKLNSMKITDFINGEVTYDKEGQFFWINTPNNGMQMLGELRGWGHIQNMPQFRIPKGKTKTIDMEAAGKFQDSIGEFVAQAINEKIKTLNK